MDGLFFMASIAAMVLLMIWVGQNEGVGLNEPTKGLFAIKESIPTDPADASKGWPGAERKRGGPDRAADHKAPAKAPPRLR